jgi:hypothetical protein
MVIRKDPSKSWFNVKSIEDRAIRLEEVLGDPALFENVSLAEQVQDLYTEISSFSKVKMSDVKAKLTILEAEANKNKNDNKVEKLNNATKKREILKKIDAMISDIEMDEKMCEKSIVALDDSSLSLELMANLLTRLHGKTEMLTEATDMAQKNKLLLDDLIKSMQTNLEIIAKNKQ